MKRILLLLGLLAIGCVTVDAQCVRYNGRAERGGQVVVTSGTSSSTKAVRSYPSSTVTIYLPGTTTLVSLYSDAACSASKANPMTASATDSSYFFYVNNQATVDIRHSGTGIATPFTLSSVTVHPSSTAEINPTAYGAVADAAVYENCAMSSSGTTVTCTGASFTSTIDGKKAVIAGAGASGATIISTISNASGTTFTSSVAASTTVSGTRVVTGTDNTTAFSSALTAASTSTATRTVLIPNGNFLFTSGSLTVPQGVQLQGAWEIAADHMGYRYADEVKPMSGAGTTLVVAANEGTATGRFIFLNSNSSLRGVAIFYPAQLATLTAPKVYPWTVEMFGTGPTVENVEVLNSYQGIYSHIGQRHVVRNVRGTPILTGFYASQQLETSRYSDITFVPIYTFSSTEAPPYPHTNLMDWISKNGTAFKFGRVDNAVCYNLFTYDYYKGFKFVVDASEVTTYANGSGAPGGKAWAQFTNCGADVCSYPVDIDNVQGEDATGAMGVTFDSCAFTAAQWNPFAGPELYSVFVRSTNLGRVGLNNCRFHLGQIHVFVESGRVNITNNFFQDWTTNVIKATGGTVTVTGNTFRLGSAAPMVVTTGSPWLSASGNMFEYQDHVVWSISSTTDFSEGGNAYSDSPLNVAVTYQNSWVDYGAGYQGVSYIKRDGRVHLRGLAKNGTVAAGTPVFTLPVGFRPPAVLLFDTTSNGAFGQIQIAADGVVSVVTGNNASVSFDGISFAVR